MAAVPDSPPAARGPRLSIGRRLFYTHLLVALIVASALGLYMHGAAEMELRANLTQRVQAAALLAAQALDQSVDMTAITGSQDTQRPEYSALLQRMRNIEKGDQAIERVVVVRLEGERATAIADSSGASVGYLPGDAIAGFAARGDAVTVLESNSEFQAFARLPSDASRYGVLIAARVDDISDKLATLRRNSLLSFIVAVVLALIISMWLARMARATFGRFALRFRDIAEGRLDQRLELPLRDEFADLARAIEDMAERLRVSNREREGAIADLKVARDQLEKSVRERTEELDRLNVMLRREIEQRCQLEAALAEAAATDSLSRLLNRRGMLELLEHAAEQARKQHTSFVLVIVDVDHFKRINDQYGHAAGDRVLGEIAKRLKAALRPNEAAARWGGEEFLLLWPGISLNDAERRANGLRELMNQGALFAGGPQVTVSMGVAEFTGLDSLDRCVIRADKALYRAKEEGRNRVCIGL